MKNKLNNLWKLVGVIGGTLFPLWIFAQTITTVVDKCSTQDGLKYILCKVSLLLNTIVPILITLGVIYFIYGVISYAIAKDNEAKTGGRAAMINGLIALLVIVSVWGLVNILKSTFKIDNDIMPPLPEVPGYED